MKNKIVKYHLKAVKRKKERKIKMNSLLNRKMGQLLKVVERKTTY